MDTPELPDDLSSGPFKARLELSARELPDALIEAGGSYYAALKKLDFHPEGLFWAYDYQLDDFRLWLIWSGLDRYGPLAISKLLFRAYNAEVLPKEIDPFLVYVINRSHAISQFMKQIESVDINNIPHKFRNSMEFNLRNPADHSLIQTTKLGWVYHINSKRPAEKKINRDWRKLNEILDALAA